jgi:TolB-like protein/predicted Ser/Thr protein kinase
VFGRYRLLGKLGEGGMGVVYLAEDTALGRRVALKTIRPEVADRTARERLRREARAAAAVSHPNVCQVYEVGEERGETFLAMELLEGESLASRLAKGPMPLAEALSTAIAILLALDAVHAKGIVHRDLKPSNVFLTPHGVKLLDFGLALPMEGGGSGGQRLTQTGFFVGTPGYMAPEQWTGEEVGGKADVFAVGAMLVEMVAGVRAFRGERAAELMHSVLHDQPPSLTGGPAVEAVDRVIQRALGKRADDRPAAGAMAEELRASLALPGGGERPAAVHIQRMVVVPFRPLRADPEIDFLPLGLADALTTSLRGIEGLSVLSSQVGARHAGDALDPRRVAETGAQLALTGTLVRSGGRLRVHAELVEVPDGRVAWSKTAEGATDDLFKLQDDLARSSWTPSRSNSPRGAGGRGRTYPRTQRPTSSSFARTRSPTTSGCSPPRATSTGRASRRIPGSRRRGRGSGGCAASWRSTGTATRPRTSPRPRRRSGARSS